MASIRKAAWRASVLAVGIGGIVPAYAEEVPVASAKGIFEVRMEPAREADAEAGVALGRFSLGKSFTGDLKGESVGEMLTATTATEGSAGYVAMERFSGTLHGRAGTFVLQHSGTMQGTHQTLAISIVPDSGTGELTGVSGTFHLRIEDGKHYYELKYTMGVE